MIPTTNPFSDSALAQVVADHLPPPEHASAAVIGTVDSSGAQVVLELTSKTGAWTVEGAYRHDWKLSNDEAHVKVIYKW